MVFEIETKLKVDSLQEIESKLGELGAAFLEEQSQTDYHFDDASARLTASDRCLRLRKQVVGKSVSFFLTYKGAKEKSNFKKRQEIEMEIKDADSIQQIFSSLGYNNILTVKKTRRVWHYHDCEIALDRLPLLGYFVEIEGPNDETITNVQKCLGLADLSHIKKSYAILIKEELNRRKT